MFNQKTRPRHQQCRIHSNVNVITGCQSVEHENGKNEMCEKKRATVMRKNGFFYYVRMLGTAHIDTRLENDGKNVITIGQEYN